MSSKIYSESIQFSTLAVKIGAIGSSAKNGILETGLYARLTRVRLMLIIRVLKYKN